MDYKQCLHTHSVFCDGRDTLEELVLTAMEKGFASIGFSGHSYLEEIGQYSMDETDTAAYNQEITRLQAHYGDRIRIYRGMEKDNYTTVSTEGYDYLLGSVHIIRRNDAVLFVDWSADRVIDQIEKYFDGDSLSYAESYYQAVAELPDYGPFDILAHFDLVTKFSEQYPELIDTEHPRYRAAAIGALEALAGRVKYFEVNTGAISRGYRTTPYPAPFLLEQMRRLGFRPVISSDCHDRNFLDCGYDEARQLLRQAGFTHHYVLKDEGFVPIPLED